MFESKGLKRRIVAAIALLIAVLRGIPGTAEIVALLDAVAGALGGVALAHAATAGTLRKEKIAGILAVVQLLILVSIFVPAMLPVLPLLQKAAALLAAMNLGKALA